MTSHVAHAMPPHLDRTLRRMLVAVFMAAFALLAGRAMADEPSPADKPAASSVHAEQSGEGAKKRTVLHFGDDDIHGDLTRPAGELVQAPRKPSSPTLLRVRKNFLDRALSGVQSGQ